MHIFDADKFAVQFTSTLLILLITSPHQHVILATAKKASENICVFQSSLYE